MSLSYAHHEAHDGRMFSYHHAETLNSAEVFDVLVTQPDVTRWGHLVFDAAGSGEATLEVYENPTISDAGAAQTEYNHNRNSANTSNVVVTSSPTVGATGSVKLINHLFGTGRQAGGEARETNEWILKQNEQYLFRVTSAANGNNLALRLTWYEHTDK